MIYERWATDRKRCYEAGRPTHLPTGQSVHIGTLSAMIELLYFPPAEVFEYLPMPQAMQAHDSASHSEPSGQASVGSGVGEEEGAHVVYASGSVSQQGVPKSLPVVTCQPELTLLERACTCVGTSSQSWFD